MIESLFIRCYNLAMLDTVLALIVRLGFTMLYIIAIISYGLAQIKDRVQGRKLSKQLVWHRLTHKDNP